MKRLRAALDRVRVAVTEARLRWWFRRRRALAWTFSFDRYPDPTKRMPQSWSLRLFGRSFFLWSDPYMGKGFESFPDCRISVAFYFRRSKRTTDKLLGELAAAYEHGCCGQCEEECLMPNEQLALETDEEPVIVVHRLDAQAVQ